MAKRNVDIAIRARDRASKKFKKISRATGGLTSALKKAAGAAAVFFGTRALFRFGKESLVLFGRQEEAVISLADALENLGLPRATKEYEDFATEIQKVTRLGDEQVLELQTMGATMAKLSGVELRDATKASIGLAKAFKVDVVAAMRLVARAAVGDTGSLSRYGITLDTTLTKQEKFNAVLKIGADNFDLAKGSALSYNGQLEQTSNIIGDVRELIGEKLAPTVLRSAKQIRDWATENQDRIGTWAERTVSAFGKVKNTVVSQLGPVFKSSAARIRDWASENRENIGNWAQRSVDFVVDVKDSLVSFAAFMKNDFTASMKLVWDNFLIILKAAFDSAVILSVAAGKAIAAGIESGINKSINEMTGIRGIIARQIFGDTRGEQTSAAQEEAFAQSGGELLSRSQVNLQATDKGLFSGGARREFREGSFTPLGAPGKLATFIRNEDLEKFRSFRPPEETGPSAFARSGNILRQAFGQITTNTEAAQGIPLAQPSLRARAFRDDPSFRQGTATGGGAIREVKETNRLLAQLINLAERDASAMPGQNKLNVRLA